MRLPFALIAVSCALTGCVADTGDQPADESDDVTASNSGVFIATANEKAGGDIAYITTVKRANMAKTKCDDGKSHATCIVGGLDFSALHLSAAKQQQIDAAFRAGHALLEGKLVAAPANLPLSVPHMARIVVTKAWIGASGATIDALDSVYQVRARAEACNGCATIGEDLVNSSGGGAVYSVNLDGVAASKTELAAASKAMGIGGPGLLVAGLNHTLIHGGVGSGVTSKSDLYASEFYLPFQ